MIDIDNELFELYMEVKKVKKFKNMFLDSPFLKKERAREKSKIYLVLCCKVISSLMVFMLGCFFLHKYLYENMILYKVLSLVNLFVFLIISAISVRKALDKFARLAGHRNFHRLKKTVVYEAFKRRLISRNFTVNQIEKYLLPHLKSQNKDKQEGSAITFLKNQIPAIFISIITSFFTVIINTAVSEPNLNQKDLNDVMITWIGLGIQMIVLSTFTFKFIHHFQDILDYKKNHVLLETLFYNFLLEKERASIQKSKRAK